MPHYRDPFTKGNLIINFEVVFPSEDWFLDLPKLIEMEKVLPPKQEQIGKFTFSKDNVNCVIEICDDFEEIVLEDYDEFRHTNTRRGPRNFTVDDDDLDDIDAGTRYAQAEEGPGVQCQQQ